MKEVESYDLPHRSHRTHLAREQMARESEQFADKASKTSLLGAIGIGAAGAALTVVTGGAALAAVGAALTMGVSGGLGIAAVSGMAHNSKFEGNWASLSKETEDAYISRALEQGHITPAQAAEASYSDHVSTPQVSDWLAKRRGISSVLPSPSVSRSPRA